MTSTSLYPFRQLSQSLLVIGGLLFGLQAGQAQINKSTDGITPKGLAPGAPAGSYPVTEWEDINLFNGQVSFTLPIVQAGRGETGVRLPIRINRTPWIVKHQRTVISNTLTDIFNAETSWWNSTVTRPILSGGSLVGRYSGANIVDCYGDGTGFYMRTNTRLTFTAPDGTEFTLIDREKGGTPRIDTCNFTASGYRGSVFITPDGTTATFYSNSGIEDLNDAGNSYWSSPDPQFYPSGYLMMRDGTRYDISYGNVTRRRDRNGNETTYQIMSGGLGQIITDSLKRQIIIDYDVYDVAPYGLCDRITLKGFGGADRVIRISYSFTGNGLRTTQSTDPTTPWTMAQLFPQLDNVGSGGGPRRVSAIYLPDNRSYQFKYNVYSELARVDLPTGGAIEYDWTGGEPNGTASGVIGEYTFPRYPANPNQVPLIGVYRRLVERRVYKTSDLASLEGKTTYSKPVSSGSGSSLTSDMLVEQWAPNGSSFTCVGRSKHYFRGSAYQSQISNLIDSVGSQDLLEGRESRTDAMDTTSLTALRQVEHSWSNGSFIPNNNFGIAVPINPRIIETKTTLVDTNQVTKQTFTYSNDEYNNQTDVYEYDFGTGTPGAFIRRTHTDYVTVNNGVNYATTNTIHIRNLPSQTQIFSDAAGTVKKAETKFEYDNYTPDATHAALVNRVNITGLDAAFTTSYTTRGNVTKVSRWRNTDNTYLTTFSQYDIAGNTVATIDAGLSNGTRATTTIDYADRFGSPDGEAQSNTPPANPNWLAGKSTFAFPTKVTNALNQSAYTQFDYFLGQPVDTEDANSVKSSLYYQDALDRPTKGVRAVGTALVNQTVLAYNDALADRYVTVYTDKDSLNDGTLQSRSYYDGLGRTWHAGTMDNAGQWRWTDTEFDALGRVYRVSNPFIVNSTLDPAGRWTSTTYDALSRVVSVTSPDGAQVGTTYSGNTVTVTDQANRKRKSATDALGRLTSVWEDPTGLNHQTDYQYDVLGNLVHVTQGIQHRYFMYDSLGRLLRARNPEQTVNSGLALSDPITGNSSWTIGYAYDPNGNLTTRTDAKAQDTYFEYDALNRAKLKYYSSTNTAQVNYYYDNQTLPSGAPTYSRGSSIGRMVAVTFGGSYPTGASEGDYYGYDQLGRVTTKYQRTGTTNYGMSATYNLAGAMLSETYPSGHIAKWTYNAAGQLDTFKGRLLGEASDKNYATGMSYNAANQLLKETYGTTTPLYHRMNYNRRLQLFNVRLGTDNSAINDTSTDPANWTNGARNRGELTMYYTSDFTDRNATPSATNNNGNVWRVDHFAPENDAVTTWSKAIDKYHYDALNRIIDVEEDKEAHNQAPVTTGLAQRYTYDRYGNRSVTNATSNFPVFNLPFSVDVNTNRLGVGIGQTGTMTYDANGSLINDTYTGKGTRTYDSEGRMTQARGAVLDSSGYPTGLTALDNYTYDGNGKRIKRQWAQGSASTFQTRVQVYGIGGELLAEYNSATLEREYGYRGGQLLLVANQTSLGFYYQFNVTDHLGSTRMSVTDTGSLTNLVRRDFLPYGEELTAGVALRGTAGGYYGGNDPMRQKFTGYERDVEINLDFAQARYMNNSQGRFASVDPFNPLMGGDESSIAIYANQPQNWNKYSYSLNQPIRYIDRDGKNPLIAVGAIIGGVVGAGAKYVELKAKGEEVTTRKLVAAGVSGAIGGAIAGATGGASLLVQVGATSAANVVGGIVERGIDADDKTTAGDLGEIISDGYSGVFGAFTGGKVGKAATSLYFTSEPFDIAFTQARKALKNGTSLAATKNNITRLTSLKPDTLSFPNVIKLGAEEIYGKTTEDAVFKLAFQVMLNRSLVDKSHISVECGAPGSKCRTDVRECLDCK